MWETVILEFGSPINYGAPWDNKPFVQLTDHESITPTSLYIRGGGITTNFDVRPFGDYIHYNTWTHFVLTYEGTLCKIYINGVFQVSGAVDAISSAGGSTGFRMGGVYGWRKIGSDNAYWDITRIYHSVLIEAQILNNFNVEKSRFGL